MCHVGKESIEIKANEVIVHNSDMFNLHDTEYLLADTLYNFPNDRRYLQWPAVTLTQTYVPELSQIAGISRRILSSHLLTLQTNPRSYRLRCRQPQGVHLPSSSLPLALHISLWQLPPSRN